MLGVVQGLLGLVQVQVLGRSALGHQYDIRPGRDLLAVKGVQKGTARPVGSHQIAGNGLDDLLVGVQHHIYDEVHPHHGGGFFNVLPDRVALQFSGTGGIFHHSAVVGLDGRPGGDAGHDGLGAAGVAGKVMVFNIAQADAPVRLRHGPHDMYAIRRVSVHAADLRKSPFAGQVASLLLCVGTVTSQSEYQRDVLPPDPGGVQLVQQGGHDLPCGHGTGDITRNDTNSLSGMDHLPQPIVANGMLQRILHSRFF